MTTQEFYNLVYNGAINAGFSEVQAAICAAQSAMETGWGKTVKGNGYFGIKAGKSWKGRTIDFTTHEVIKGKRVKIIGSFRAYDSLQESILDWGKMIQEKFPDVWSGRTIQDAAKGLDTGVHGKYATDPKYSSNVAATAIKRSKLVGVTSTVSKPKPKNPKSKLLPLYRPNQPKAVTRGVLQKFSSLTPPDRRNDPVKILVVRGYFRDSMGEVGKNDRAIYDDAVFVVTPTNVQSFNGNSDPGAFRKRIATLKAPQAVRYKPGIHGISGKYPHPAFRQNSSVTVTRDDSKLDHTDGDGVPTFWINLHRGGTSTTSSAGCLTIPRHQWDEFYKLVTTLLKKHNQKTFYVTLVEYAGGEAPVVIPKEVPKVTVGLLVGTAVIVSAFMENVFGWFAGIMEKIGGML